jgi:hypothetical protein
MTPLTSVVFWPDDPLFAYYNKPISVARRRSMKLRRLVVLRQRRRRRRPRRIVRRRYDRNDDVHRRVRRLDGRTNEDRGNVRRKAGSGAHGHSIGVERFLRILEEKLKSKLEIIFLLRGSVEFSTEIPRKIPDPGFFTRKMNNIPPFSGSGN